MTTIDLSTRIPGWGADADPEKRPGFPRLKTPENTGAHDNEFTRAQQPIEKHKYHSIERPDMTHVFGSTCPPRGISGLMRRFSFKYSEGTMAHWLILLMADRVDVVEGLVSDLAHGHIPNIYKEMGLASEVRHNKARFLASTALMGAGIFALYSLVTRDND